MELMQRFANTSQVNEKKQEQKQKLFSKYCKGNYHIIKNCPKLAAKEAGLVVAEVSAPKTKSANLVQNEEWAFTIVCSFDPSSPE